MSEPEKGPDRHPELKALYKKYRNREYIRFMNVPETKGTSYLEPIIYAIEKKKVLRIYYHPYYEDKPYFNVVHPYLLKEHEYMWYLVGLNAFREQVRTYALDRIRDLEPVPETPFREPEFNVPGYFRNVIGIIAPQHKPPLVKLAVQKTQARYLITQPWHETQNIIEEGEEEVVFSFRVHPTYEFKSKVLSLGKDGRVLEPSFFQDEMVEEISEMLTNYGTRSPR